MRLASVTFLDSGELGRIGGIRLGILESWAQGGWRPYWWDVSAYMTAQSLQFLSRCGGIPDDVRRCESASLARATAPASSFEAAQRLIAWVHLLGPDHAAGSGGAAPGLAM